jgi:hypothetical protein
MSDATFKFFRPYILEILHVIVRNESMPIAFAVFPTETGQSYLRMYRHVLEVLKKRKKPADLLTKLPFMSDRGSGLTKFISELKEEDGLLLWWFLCHRHLIENAGASSLAGDWVRLLLQCCTDSECIEAAQTILMEFDKLTEQQKVEFSKPENHHLLKSMLAAVKMEMAPSLQFSWEQPEVDPFESKFWARWVRNGCPTTTNAAESIHRWLNEIAETFGKTGFSGRYIKLVRYLQDRFDNRNSPTRKNERSTVRLMKKINGLKPPLSDADQALLDFNLKLHGSNGNPWVLGQDEHWEFPPWNAETQGFKEFLTETCTDEVPRSWKPERTDDISIAEAQSLRLFDLDMPDDSDLIPSAEVDGPSSAEEPRSINPDTPVSRVYLDNAWKIIRCVRRLMSEREWTRQGTWKIVIDTVHRCGADYRSREALTLDEKVEWKFGVFKELRLRFHV